MELTTSSIISIGILAWLRQSHREKDMTGESFLPFKWPWPVTKMGSCSFLGCDRLAMGENT